MTKSKRFLSLACPFDFIPVYMLVVESINWEVEMKKRFSEEQIIRILQEAEAVGNAKSVTRKHNISEQTFYRWRNKYGGMEVSEAKRLKSLEKENAELKRLVADLTLDKRMLKDVLSKKS